MANDGEDLRPIGARVTTDMIGQTTPALRLNWSERDTMLYALGVGAGLGAPETELCFTTENSGGMRLHALPSFLTILAAGNRPAALDRLDVSRFLHAEQVIELLRPLPPAGSAWVTTRLSDVLDKGPGAGAIIVLTSTLSADERGDDVIGRGRMSIFVRGAGGFDGPRGTAASSLPQNRAPDARIVHETRPEQALLYRLSGDRHRLHSDPSFARENGFDRPILHGLCTYGFACRALVDAAAAGDPDRLLGMSGRFSKPVYPGDTLTTEIWREAEGAIRFRTSDSAGAIVLDRGTARVAV